MTCLISPSHLPRNLNSNSLLISSFLILNYLDWSLTQIALIHFSCAELNPIFSSSRLTATSLLSAYLKLILVPCISIPIACLLHPFLSRLIFSFYFLFYLIICCVNLWTLLNC